MRLRHYHARDQFYTNVVFYVGTKDKIIIKTINLYKQSHHHCCSYRLENYFFKNNAI